MDVDFMSLTADMGTCTLKMFYMYVQFQSMCSIYNKIKLNDNFSQLSINGYVWLKKSFKNCTKYNTCMPIWRAPKFKSAGNT